MASPLRYHGYWLLGFREICTVTLGTEAQTFGTEAQKNHAVIGVVFYFNQFLLRIPRSKNQSLALLKTE
ncbi:hypothetical protein N9D38_11400 [Rubripirellula sp.]|nr:hypothetical protein [Rubripirellula sp.]